MSRGVATGVINRKTGEPRLDPDGTPKRAPLITPDMMHAAVRNAGVELRGAGVDQSPHCYKRIKAR